MRPDVTHRAGRFFAYARARHEIYLRKSAGEPWPWTNDDILMTFRFTNVYRELDKTTVWLRKLTNQVRDDPRVLPLIVVMRWINKIETWDRMLTLSSGSVGELVQSVSDPVALTWLLSEIRRQLPRGPWVTGAYIIKTPEGFDKLEGVRRISCAFLEQSGWPERATHMLSGQREHSLRRTWEWLLAQDHQGPFTAYEAVSDMRWTDLLRDPTDHMTWANPGPGAMRGLNRIHGRDLHYSRRSHDWCSEMREILAMSQDGRHWPSPTEAWPQWEMREVEHTLCEFDKYERVRLGQGAPRQRYP